MVSKIKNKILVYNSRKRFKKMDNEFDSTNHFGKNVFLVQTKWGKYSSCNDDSIISQTIIGNYCQIANQIQIAPRNHIFNNFTICDFIYRETKEHLNYQGIWDNKYLVKIGNDVWIGAKSIILPGVEIGNGSIIAAGSIISKSIPAYSIVGGNPCRFIKYRFQENVIKKLEEIKWYELSQEEILKRRTELETVVKFSYVDYFNNCLKIKKSII